MFADSGLCVPYSYVTSGLRLIKSKNCEIAHGSRKLAESKILKPQVWRRRVTAKLFRRLMIFWQKIPSELTDTQCGFKIYRGEIARKLYSECKTAGFMFDIEIILRALKRGYRIKEFPIEWTADLDSRLSVNKSAKQVLTELFKIKSYLA